MFMSKLTSQVISNWDYPVVETKRGKVRGLEKEGAFIFRGIKYANSRRFHMPTEVPRWDGVKNATVYGCVCPELLPGIAADEQINPHYYMPQDENCQYLNVWTQSIDRAARKPVMVWIHGGGWSTGSGVELFAYDGENLSRHGDVVVVSLNHRLNCLGYLDLSSFGPEYEQSTMSGLGDLVLALRWVRDNIAEFGGDPDNVTVFGQSGGGSKILFLMQTPEADGLFGKACVQSGGAVYGVAPEGRTLKELSTRLGELTAGELGLDAGTIGKIETVPFWRLAEAVSAALENLKKEKGNKGYRWEPIADGRYCMGSPYIAGFRKETSRIPMIMGSVFGEQQTNAKKSIGSGSKNDWDDATVRALIRQDFGERGDAVIEEFKKAYPDHALVDVLFLDRYDRKKIYGLTKKRAEGGGKIWNYVFKLESPVNGGTISWHCSDIPFVFRNSQYVEAAFIPGVSDRLQDQMSEAWLAFAKTGNPNHAGIPEWPAATKDRVPAMLFDKESRVAVDHDAKLLDIIPQLNKLV